MGPEKEKEEIIELTEVLEESPVFPGPNARPERAPSEPEERNPPARPSPAAKEVRSAPADFDPATVKEILVRQAETWLANDGARILEKVAREIFPKIAEKVLRQEIEKLREESRASAKE